MHAEERARRDSDGGVSRKLRDSVKTEAQSKAIETPKTAESKPDASKPADAPKPADASKPAATPFVDVATELDEDRKPSIHTGGDVFIKGATILTVTKGTIAKGSILIKDGKIKAVGTGMTAPEGVTVIDAAGLVAMPGIIDTHSHIAVQGGVNEGDAFGRAGGSGQGRGHRRRDRDLSRPWREERRRPACSTARPTRSAGRMPSSSCGTASRAAT